MEFPQGGAAFPWTNVVRQLPALESELSDEPSPTLPGIANHSGNAAIWQRELGGTGLAYKPITS
jgi:hypothetical protein